MKESEEDRPKYAVYESTLSTAVRSPFPDGEGKEAAASLQKGSQPRLAALGSPFQGKGLAWMLPPSYGRRCPEGAEVGWGKRYPRRKAFPNGEGCETRIPLFSHCQNKYTHMWKKNNDGQSLPPEGKVASKASRIGY